VVNGHGKDGDMDLPSDEMDEIIEEFVVESEESLESLDQMFVALEKNPGDKDLLNEIFRCAHTIKGASGFLGFQRLVEVAHVSEDVLNKLRKGELVATAEVMDAVLKAMDIIKEMLTNIKNTREEGISPSVDFIRNILEGSSGDGTAGAEGEGEEVSPEANAAGTGTEQEKISSDAGAFKAEEAKKASDANASEEKREEEKPSSLTCEEQSSVPKEEAAPAQIQAAPAGDGADKGVSNKKTAPPHKEREHNIRVDISKLDDVLNLVGELVLSRNRLMRLGTQLNDTSVEEEIVAHTDVAIAQLDLVTSDLQLAVMKMRMQPIAKVFNKFPRMVRDLARQSAKEIDLKLIGEETELDKTVIEEIGDPLIHLIRNSVDHGVESPDDRETAGKPRCGTISLSASQEGQNIVVCVEDDGKGIDAEKIKASAIKKGVITTEEAAKLSNKEAMDLIFRPGFSTVKKVSDISGRGVGMDVVKTHIANINGHITIESKPGFGSKILLRLPLTLAIIQILIVKSGEEIYGIPLINVVENIRVKREDVKTIEGRDVIRIRERVLPVARLDTIVRGGSFVEENKKDNIFIVIIGVGEKRFGLLVDELCGQEEIVMKSMGEYMKGTEGVAGASITGDGKVVLILDAASALDSQERRPALAS